MAWVIFYEATWKSVLITGPLAAIIVNPEKAFCRKNWWINLLFLNNYMNIDEPCVQQTWYLATYFQLFIITIILFMILWRFPNTKYFLLTITILFSAIVPGVVTYVYKLDGIFTQGFEARKFRFRFDDMYKYFYIPTHTNCGCFLAGIVGGWIYFNLKRQQINLRKNKVMVEITKIYEYEYTKNININLLFT